MHLRKLKYVFDARVLAARLLDSYGAAPPVRAPLGGSVQPRGQALELGPAVSVAARRQP
ncbi:MAG: hypothetical protein AABY85_09310 [Gemmatimonadota bacterium]